MRVNKRWITPIRLFLKIMNGHLFIYPSIHPSINPPPKKKTPPHPPLKKTKTTNYWNKLYFWKPRMQKYNTITIKTMVSLWNDHKVLNKNNRYHHNFYANNVFWKHNIQKYNENKSIKKNANISYIFKCKRP